MSADMLSIQALFNVLFFNAGPGMAVVEYDRMGKVERYVARHALDVSDEGEWTKAVWTGATHGIPLRIRPLLYTRAVRRGIGTEAHNVSFGTHLRGQQRTVQVRWPVTPSAEVVQAFADSGGHVIEGVSDCVGLLVTSRLNLSKLQTLQEETARVFGATVSNKPLAIARGRGLSFVTDPARGLLLAHAGEAA